MKICVYRDETIDLRLEEIVPNLNRLAPSLHFRKGNAEFSLPEPVVLAYRANYQIGKAIDKETSKDDDVFLFTEKPSDNNFFFDSFDKKVIVSLSGWDHLTDLSRNNGAVYFVCAILVRGLDAGNTHEKNTGCINDFWWDKTGVDIGMRSAFICPLCLQEIRKHATPQRETTLHEIEGILNDLSAASRSNMDICDFWALNKGDSVFDVFLCYNSKDKQAVSAMNDRLKKSGISTWFDEEQLPPGRLWQEILEEQIAQINSVAVFVGKGGIGPWQNMEVRAFLSEFTRRRCPVIPVILSDCNNVPQLPLFLSQLTWVDFRKSAPDPYDRLLWGITTRTP